MKKCVQKGSKVDEEGNLSGASGPEGHIPGVDQHARFQSGGLLPGEHPVAGIAVVIVLRAVMVSAVSYRMQRIQ